MSGEVQLTFDDEHLPKDPMETKLSQGKTVNLPASHALYDNLLKAAQNKKQLVVCTCFRATELDGDFMKFEYSVEETKAGLKLEKVAESRYVLERPTISRLVAAAIPFLPKI